MNRVIVSLVSNATFITVLGKYLNEPIHWDMSNEIENRDRSKNTRTCSIKKLLLLVLFISFERKYNHLVSKNSGVGNEATTTPSPPAPIYIRINRDS